MTTLDDNPYAVKAVEWASAVGPERSDTAAVMAVLALAAEVRDLKKHLSLVIGAR